MPRAEEYLAHLLDLLHPIGPVRTARFFGGVSMRLNGRQFAMVMDGRLYFAVNDVTSARYEAAGSTAFSYATKKGRVDVRRYREVPIGVQEDAVALCAWAREAAVA